jgi:hypothetical protein
MKKIKNPIKIFPMFFAVVVLLTLPSLSADLGSKTGVMWEYLEWNLSNPSYTGNAFDVIATVTFNHQGSGKQHETQMFYTGSNTWKFRFTGTHTGTWTFTTQSSDPDLNGHTGQVTVTSNPDPKITGFLTGYKNRFALQTGNSGELSGFLFNVFQHQDTDKQGIHIRDAGILQATASFMNTYIGEAYRNGFNVLFFLPMDPNVWTDGTNPRFQMFDKVDLVVTAAHKNGMRVDFWLWGDAQRSYTPGQEFSGGALGAEAKRLYRYIAARMAPLPGWTMGYGFDLQEWASESETQNWAAYMHQHMGWQHLLWARGRRNPELDVNTYSGISHSYGDAVNNLNRDLNRPHHFGERDYYPSRVSADWTIQHLWRYAMAGGHGGHFGYKGSTNMGSFTYANAEQMRTHFAFWHINNRFLLNMQRASNLGTNYCLKTPDNSHYVFYYENSSTLNYNLTGMGGSNKVVAVDTKKKYAEIDLGTKSPGAYTYNAPYSSNWAIAVGEFTLDTLSVRTGQNESRIPAISLQAHPNPFASRTTINIRITEDNNGKGGNIDLRIFDINGKLVMSKSVYTPSSVFRLPSSFNWDALNQPCGLYLIKVRVKDKTYQKKISLIK